MFLASFVLFACGDDDDDNPMGSGSGAGSVDVPAAYEFDSRFTPGQSSVVYTGQTVRNLLLQDLKIFTLQDIWVIQCYHYWLYLEYLE